jgi:methyl-accepting chemotaxis protein
MGFLSFFHFRSLGAKLMAVCVWMGILPVIITGFLSFGKSQDTLLRMTGQSLRLMAENMARELDRNLYDRYRDLLMFTSHPQALEGMDSVTLLLDRLVKDSPYYELMLVTDEQGVIIGCNSHTSKGDPVDTQKVLQRRVNTEDWFVHCSKASPQSGEVYLGELTEDPLVAAATKTRGLSLNFATPIFDASGNLLRVWSSRISWPLVIDPVVDDIKKLGRNQGRTWQVNVISKEGIALEDPEPSALLALNLGQTNLKAAKELIAGRNGWNIEPNTRSHFPQLNGYAVTKGHDRFPGFGWGVMVRQYAAEAAQEANALRSFTLWVGCVAGILISGLAWWVGRSIARPMQTAVETLEKVAEGDLTQRLRVRSHDEVGRLSKALNRVVESFSRAIRGIDHRAVILAKAASDLSQVSRQLSDDADQTSSQANTASDAGGKVSLSVQNVAGATEQMAACLREISKNSGDAASVSVDAAREADKTTATMFKLQKSTEKIGEVISLINNVAQQTNLLALNASIEAARAGEAGQGFVVVANEVKELAKQTSEATDEIVEMIQTIQTDSESARYDIGRIADVIHQIRDFQNSIASAVEEESATTDEVSKNIAGTAHAAAEIARNVTGLAQNATRTKSRAADVEDASAELARLSSELRNLVRQFQYE